MRFVTYSMLITALISAYGALVYGTQPQSVISALHLHNKPDDVHNRIIKIESDLHLAYGALQELGCIIDIQQGMFRLYDMHNSFSPYQQKQDELFKRITGLRIELKELYQLLDQLNQSASEGQNSVISATSV